MVQTREQYTFCYIAIEQWLDEALHAPSSIRLPSDAPQRDFETLLRHK
jgi:hypothetical protein